MTTLYENGDIILIGVGGGHEHYIWDVICPVLLEHDQLSPFVQQIADGNYIVYDMAAHPERGDALDHIDSNTPLVVAHHLFGIGGVKGLRSRDETFFYNARNNRLLSITQDLGVPLLVFGDQPVAMNVTPIDIGHDGFLYLPSDVRYIPQDIVQLSEDSVRQLYGAIRAGLASKDPATHKQIYARARMTSEIAAEQAGESTSAYWARLTRWADNEPSIDPYADIISRDIKENPSQRALTIKAKMDALYEQRRRVSAMLAETKLISAGKEPRRTIMLLHPSTRSPDKWQVSYFDEHGPYGHEEGATQEAAIDHALELRDLSGAHPMTEQEFMDISSTPEFIEGTKRVTYVGLLNQIGYEFGGSDLATQYTIAAQQAKDLDEAIEILHQALLDLRQQA